MRNPQDFKNNYISLDGKEDLINRKQTEKTIQVYNEPIFMEKEIEDLDDITKSYVKPLLGSSTAF